jgi:hypothetical protein
MCRGVKQRGMLFQTLREANMIALDLTDTEFDIVFEMLLPPGVRLYRNYRRIIQNHQMFHGAVLTSKCEQCRLTVYNVKKSGGMK